MMTFFMQFIIACKIGVVLSYLFFFFFFFPVGYFPSYSKLCYAFFPIPRSALVIKATLALFFFSFFSFSFLWFFGGFSFCPVGPGISNLRREVCGSYSAGLTLAVEL